MTDQDAFWEYKDVSVGLVYPNRLKVMLSSYTIRFLHNYLQTHGIFSDRFYMPEKFLFPARKDLNPDLRSYEHKLVPNKFDIIGFSIHYENDLRNILWFLEKARLPFKANERYEKDERYPIIISGGPVITSNPLPFSKIFDFYFIGDSENNLLEFLSKYENFKKKQLNYKDLVKQVEKLKGIFIPSLKNKVFRNVLHNLDYSPIPSFQNSEEIPDNQLKNSFFVELNRGCPYKCKFCLSTYHNSPFRNRSYQNIIESINKGIKNSNFKKISLIGSCASSHPQFKEICEYVIGKDKDLSIPSIRIEHITPKLLSVLEGAGLKTITIAPETGAENLRFQIGKKISNDFIFQTIKKIRESMIRNIKFYFLVGLPGETDEDIQETVYFINRLEKLSFERDSLRININPFVPKLNTPFESQTTFYLRENLKILKERLKYLVENLSNKASIKLKVKKVKQLVNQARLQTVISLGDDIIGEFLLEYYKNGADLGALRRVEKSMDISIDEYLKKINSGYKPWSL